MEIIWKPSPNYSLGRNGRSIIAIVDHITAGSASGAIAWLSNPASQASAHYVVARTGEIVQLVAEENRAWHAGIVNRPDWFLYDGTNPNNYTIGIEHEGYDGTLIELQYQATLWLHRQITAKYAIPADTNHIVGHYRIDSINRPNCPGPNFPWSRLFADLTGLQTVNIIYNGQVMQGYIIEDRTWAPVRAIAEFMGRTVQWDAATNTALVLPVNIPIVPTTDIKVVVGSTTLPTKLFNQRSYAPVRALAAALGHQVNWDAANNTVIII